ncbi:hypothetical protein M9H77_04747 [Catharanthus roseus]|uniref:Uncharacterized protein n=1 Tax=Catharanthus roseus TaxID=4058 RepID=A0ACC0CFE8_CATRO|nr:hypothetical protein M9H77_04747 [Catharanthus roseus]
MQSCQKLGSFSSSLLVALISIAIIITCSIIHPVAGNYNVSFSVDLIHRDSPKSPFYNHNLSRFERLDLAMQHAQIRSRLIGKSGLILDGGEYLMKVSYGTPPFDFFSIVDTGSELSWIQCLPCTHCFRSKTSPFNPKKSRTFKYVPHPLTDDQFLLQEKEKNISYSYKPKSIEYTSYSIEYEDGSYSRGELARDTVTVGNRIHLVSFPDFLFGCGRDNGGRFSETAAGIVGFAPQPDSFISQLKITNFAYCLAPYGSTTAGRISFGREAVVSGPGVVSTPLILDQYYNVMLKEISVGNIKVKYFQDGITINGGAGKILIDSGTQLTYLPKPLLSKIQGILRQKIRLRPVRNQGHYTLCYPLSLRNYGDVPKITFHFNGGANLQLNPSIAFCKISSSAKCLSLLPTDDTPIFGHMAQQNVLVGFDIDKKKLSFKPMDCTRY